MYPTFTMVGETGIIITLGDKLTMEINSYAIAAENTIRQHQPDYIIESAPLLRSVFIRYDCRKIDFDAAVAHIKDILTLPNPPHPPHPPHPPSSPLLSKPRLWHLPICYDKQYAPDIDELAKLMQLSAAEIIAAHSCEILQILMLGFAPGWIYGGLLPPVWNIPRLAAAKPNVPAGSVSVAVQQVIISTTLSPTGWRTIGRTPYLNYDPTRKQDEIFTMQAGDKIKPQKISPQEFTLLQKDFAAGRKSLSYEEIG